MPVFYKYSCIYNYEEILCSTLSLYGVSVKKTKNQKLNPNQPEEWNT